MKRLGSVSIWASVFLLLASAVWANLGNTSFPELRGKWVTQATRGMASY
jgi:hypothetical protein